jgi:hypothetical protein
MTPMRKGFLKVNLLGLFGNGEGTWGAGAVKPLKATVCLFECGAALRVVLGIVCSFSGFQFAQVAHLRAE